MARKPGWKPLTERTKAAPSVITFITVDGGRSNGFACFYRLIKQSVRFTKLNANALINLAFGIANNLRKPCGFDKAIGPAINGDFSRSAIADFSLSRRQNMTAGGAPMK
jgi:hypothetical protein